MYVGLFIAIYIYESKYIRESNSMHAKWHGTMSQMQSDQLRTGTCSSTNVKETWNYCKAPWNFCTLVFPLNCRIHCRSGQVSCLGSGSFGLYVGNRYLVMSRCTAP